VNSVNLLFVQLRVCIFLAFLVLGNATGFCSMALPLDLSEISKEADIIADVTVQTTNSYWTSPTGVKSIHTLVNFTVNQMLKGKPSQTLALEFLGGRVGDRALQVPGIPEFSSGERYIVFSYAPEKAIACPILGLDQGALRIVHDNESNVDRVFRLWGQPVSEKYDFKSRFPIAQGSTTRDYLRSADTVDDCVKRIREALNR
jgi:hypothetical protein